MNYQANIEKYKQKHHDDTDEELIHALHEAMGVTIEKLTQMAAIVSILDSRSPKGTTLNLPMVRYLRLIASGQLLPEALIQCVGRKCVLNVAIKQTLEVQAKIASGEAFTICNPTGPNSYGQRRLPAHQMTTLQLQMTFCNGAVRTFIEQKVWLKNRRNGMASKSVGKTGFQLDLNRQGITIHDGGTFISKVELERILAKLTLNVAA